MIANGSVKVDGPLKGIRVLDWTVWQFGPVSTAMMADMGADVIKIESLDGDAGRGLWRASSLTMELGGGRNAYFETTNRGKRGMAINFKTERGREIVYKLVKDADVFVQNFRQGVAERLGMSYEKLSEINPMLVYGSANGYGPSGPDSHLPSFDGCGQARSGLMISASDPKAEYPTRVTQGVSDQIGAIMLCQGVLASLVCRHIQGKGQKVETSHLSANMWLQGMGMSMSLLNGGRSFQSYDRESPTNPLSNLYMGSDGKCIQMMHLQPDLVRGSQSAQAHSFGEELEERLRRVGPEGAASFSWLAGDLNPGGAVGDATLADADLGARLVSHYGTVLAEVIEDARAFPLDRLAEDTT